MLSTLASRLISCKIANGAGAPTYLPKKGVSEVGPADPTRTMREPGTSNDLGVRLAAAAIKAAHAVAHSNVLQRYL